MTRILTALVLIGILLGALLLPPMAFAGLIAIVAVLAWHEYALLTRRLAAAPATAPGGVLVLALALSFAVGRDRILGPVLVLLVLAAVVANLRDHYNDPAGLVRGLAATLAGLLWIGLLLGCQVGLRYRPHGVAWLLLLYGSVAVGDSAAYYGGTALGRHKLALAISPNKTIEGSLFGIAGSALAAATVAGWLPALSGWTGLFVGAALGLVGQAGDLLESALKRAAGVKDSSRLLPGHGGVLDRIDAHLLAGGLLWTLLVLGAIG